MNRWTKTGEKFDISAADAEEKFKNVRTGYGRYLKIVKSIPSGSGRDAIPVPKDFAGLDWLQQHISHIPTVSNKNRHNACLKLYTLLGHSFIFASILKINNNK